MFTGIWMWIVLAVETLVDAINRLLWWATWPFRWFTARHHDNMAAEYDQFAESMQAMGRANVAAELRELAESRREQARRLR